MTATPPRLKTRSPSPSSFLSPVQRFLPRILFNQPSFNSTGGEEWTQSINSADRVAGENLSSIDWHHEYGKERARVLILSERTGIRAVCARLWDNTIPWIVVVAIGIAVGCLAATLDVITAYFSSIRYGACGDSWWLSKAQCCTGVDVGEICLAWRSWSEIAGESTNIVLKSLLQYGIYIMLAVIFAVTSSVLVQVYAPYAFHTGIPEIKTILGGYIIVDFLSGWTLLTKSVGLPLAVASGLSLGKEGPMVHLACCIGQLMLSPFAVLRGNEARQRQILSASAAAGVSVAFNAPLGAVLFSLEEISTFFPGSTLWQSFVCAIVAAVTVQYIDPYDTGKSVLFQVTTSQVWREFELVPLGLLGIAGGLFGASFIKLNEGWERFRRNSGLRNYPVSEVAGLALFTAVVSYLMLFMRIPTSELVAQLFSECGKNESDQYGLCDTSKTWTIMTLLLVTAFAKTLFTVATFGASLPAGIFLPSLCIGACVGRAVGIFMDHLHRLHPTAWIFGNCPTEGACISPPVYAVIGAASACGGVTRLTISLVVILFELTGAVDLVLQLMMSVMVSKFTADYFSSNGVYEMWINIRNYPFLNNKDEYRRDTVVAKDVMTDVKDIVVLSDEGWTLGKIEELLASEFYRGFPIVKSTGNQIIGYVSRVELEAALEYVQATQDVTSSAPCFFGVPQMIARKRESRGPSSISLQEIDPSKRSITTVFESEDVEQETANSNISRTDKARGVDLRPWIDQAPITLHVDTPMEVVVAMFQRLGLRTILFTKKGGALGGILTKMDVHAHLRPDHQVSVRRSKSAAAPVSSAGLRNRKNRNNTLNRSSSSRSVAEESIPLSSSDTPASRLSYGDENEAQW